MKPELSIVVPSFNEESSLPLFYDQVSRQLESMGRTWEIVLVDDGSRDRTADVGKELCKRDSRVKLVCFSRNFGNQVAISAGLDAASGAAVVVMDADLQQPPEMLPEMVRLWREEGFHIVHAVRKHYTEHTGFWKRLSSRLFYQGMNFLSDTPLIPGASEFRLMDRRVVDALKNFHERARFLRGLVQWMGYRVTTVEFQANERVAGVSSFSPFKLLALACDGIVSFSTKPLRWIVYLGFFTAVACMPYALWAIYQFITMGQHGVPGWSSLIVAVIFLGGVQLISLGVIGEYVGRIYTEVKARPLYIVQERFGFDTEEEHDSVDTQCG
ncbi:MAG: glycosyltransferase family 2 protein [Planctomycetia bacterium]|nr:glycosyltransferase family 2 protein [Planctomycetia bacterium]